MSHLQPHTLAPIVEQEQQPRPTGAAKLAGKVKRAVKAFFAATNGGLSLYDVAGAEVVTADEISGKAEAERRAAAKGKAWVTEAEYDAGECAWQPYGPASRLPRRSLSGDSARSFEEQQQRNGGGAGAAVGAEQRLRKVAAVVLGAGMPSVAEAIEHTVQAQQGQQQQAQLSPGGGKLPRVSSHRSSSSSGSDVELSVMPSPSTAWAAAAAAAGPSGSGSAASSAAHAWADVAGASSSSSWASPGPSSSAWAGASASAGAGPSSSIARAGVGAGPSGGSSSGGSSSTWAHAGPSGSGSWRH